jgi:hypothetical protein
VREIVEFLYECARAGLKAELVEVEPLKGTVMKALEKWPCEQTVVERGVSLAVLFDHPEKETLLRAALRQFPGSEVLQEFTAGRRIEEV